MSSFSYVAIEGDHSVRGTVEATSAEAAKASLVAKGMHVTSVKEEKSFLQGELRLRKRLKTVDLAWLARQMAVLTDAGMGLPAALGLLARQRKGKAVGNLAEKMRQELLSGSSPSTVAATHQEELGSLFVSLVAAGEQGGAHLSRVLRIDRFRRFDHCRSDLQNLPGARCALPHRRNQQHPGDRADGSEPSGDTLGLW